MNNDSKPITAIILDDDAATRERVSELFAGKGLGCLEATSMADLTDDLLAAADILLLDLHLPESDGMETLEMAEKVVQNRVPIVILTGTRSYDFGQDSLHKGATDFLSKVDWSDEEILSKTVDAVTKTRQLAAFYTKVNE